jgi:hypothetical protein
MEALPRGLRVFEQKSSSSSKFQSFVIKPSTDILFPFQKLSFVFTNDARS